MKNFNPRSHIGEIHGVYEIVDMLDKKDKYGHWIYKGVCIHCGREKLSHYGEFSGNKGRLSTCKHIAINGDYIKQTKWENKRIGNIFGGMKSRCYDKNDRAYKWYGQKGIKICEKWLNNPKSFEEWALSNGYHDGLTIDRIEENKDYCPENCRWITLEDNSKYKSTTSLIDVDGEIHTGKDWARILGIGENRINIYIREYGEENTKEFIRRCLNDPITAKTSNQSYYNLYMNNIESSSV